ncbi:MAG: hypothetical protein WCW90_03330 [Candidatus Paceibacterota bacterium]
MARTRPLWAERRQEISYNVYTSVDLDGKELLLKLFKIRPGDAEIIERMAQLGFAVGKELSSSHGKYDITIIVSTPTKEQL